MKETVTISVGVASKSHSEALDVDDLFNRADKALYQAKEKGRNTVVSAEPY